MNSLDARGIDTEVFTMEADHGELLEATQRRIELMVQNGMKVLVHHHTQKEPCDGSCRLAE